MTVESLCREFVKKHSASLDAFHDISHIDRVVKNSKKIYSLSDPHIRESLDEDIIIAISSLHDSFDHKYFTTEEAVTVAKSQVSRFLETECMQSSETVAMIIQVIEKMGYTAEMAKNENCLSEVTRNYLNIVQDADRLDAIGAIGIARCFAYIGAFKLPIITENGLPELDQRRDFQQGILKATVRKGDSAISIFYDKLVFLKDMLKTPAGKVLGERRHQIMVRFLDELFDEMFA